MWEGATLWERPLPIIAVTFASRERIVSFGANRMFCSEQSCQHCFMMFLAPVLCQTPHFPCVDFMAPCGGKTCLNWRQRTGAKQRSCAESANCWQQPLTGKGRCLQRGLCMGLHCHTSSLPKAMNLARFHVWAKPREQPPTTCSSNPSAH